MWSIRIFIAQFSNRVFDKCVMQKFHASNLCMNSTMEHADDVGTIPDTYMNTNSYQSHCMDLSKELMTFAIGGPRFFKITHFWKIRHYG